MMWSICDNLDTLIGDQYPGAHPFCAGVDEAMRHIAISICLTTAACALPRPASDTYVPPPLADYHQHLFSPSLAALMSPPPPGAPVAPITANDLIQLLDAAGIKRAVILSTAYIWSQPRRKVANDYEKVKADNDWTAEQVALYPNRLVGFCSVNPVRDYALEELARCSKNPHFRGLKLHFGNSVVDYHNPQHVEQVRRVFAAANGYRMPIVVHMRATISEKLPYGADEARIFLNEMLPAAPDVPVQIAHLAGSAVMTTHSWIRRYWFSSMRSRKATRAQNGCGSMSRRRHFGYDAGASNTHRDPYPPGRHTARSLRNRCGDTGQLAARRMGQLSQAAVIERGVSDDREQYPAVHALMRPEASCRRPPLKLGNPQLNDPTSDSICTVPVRLYCV
jgi:predicted TIM-barrel fold metal-dependent hydrolase